MLGNCCAPWSHVRNINGAKVCISAALNAAVIEQIDVQARYAGYLARQENEVLRQQQYESAEIPATIQYDKIPGLSAELQLKLAAIRPTTIAQAKRIPGIPPAAISLLLIHLKIRA